MKYFVILLVLTGFVGIAYANEPEPVGVDMIEYGIFDPNDNNTHLLKVGTTYDIKAHFKSELDKQVSFKFLVQVQDKDKHWTEPVDEFVKTGTLNPNESKQFIFSWTPQYQGEFRTYVEVSNLITNTAMGGAPQFDFEVIKPDIDDPFHDYFPTYRIMNLKEQYLTDEPIRPYILKKDLDGCNAYKAEIFKDDHRVWEYTNYSSCIMAVEPFEIESKIQIPTTNESIKLSDTGRYTLEVEIGNYELQDDFLVGKNRAGGTLDRTVYPIVSPLKQVELGISFDEIQCKENLVLVQKYDGSPACVKPVTKQHLIERGWAESKSLDEISVNPDLIKQNIVRIEDGYISLYPENMCASLTLDLLTEQDIQRYKSDEKGLNDTNILQITSDDLKEIPKIQELISAVHSIEFPYNKYSSAYLDIVTFVEYEFFLMDKAIKKYGDSKGNYFIQIDSDYEERFIDPAKQGFTNHFIAPLIVYNENVYSIDGVYFWTSDEHKPKRMGVYPQDTIQDDEKFIMLTEEDMKSVPKIKEAIENIGTVQESISARKGLPEDQWKQYREWFEQKSQERLNSDRFRLIQYNEHLYSIGFSIC